MKPPVQGMFEEHGGRTKCYPQRGSRCKISRKRGQILIEFLYTEQAIIHHFPAVQFSQTKTTFFLDELEENV